MYLKTVRTRLQPRPCVRQERRQLDLPGSPVAQYAKVIWQNSELGDGVKPEGWSAWDATSSTAGLVFKEFNNSGPGAVKGSRAAFSGQLDKPVAITEVLGERYAKEWFVDTSYL